MDQTWYFCIGTMVWQIWYPENLGLDVYSSRRGCLTRYVWESSWRAFPLCPPRVYSRPPPRVCPRRDGYWYRDGVEAAATHARRLEYTSIDVDQARSWNPLVQSDLHQTATGDTIRGDGREGGHRRKATGARATRRKFAATIKDSRTKIVGTTILVNGKSKMPNTWR